MRRLSNQLVHAFNPPARDEDLIPEIGAALNCVRGRPVRLHAFPFPPDVANGLWIDRQDHDVIAYEKRADLEHQIVIIGHEIWHMFQGHCISLTSHGPTAARAKEEGSSRARQLVAEICEDIDQAVNSGHTVDPVEHLRASMQFALRADSAAAHREEEADRFGVRFATALQAHREEVQSLVGLEDTFAGRIRLTMAHRFR
ncbi:hypothetical protein ACWC24_18345 [Streptomyces sp. NPDC001443]